MNVQHELARVAMELRVTAEAIANGYAIPRMAATKLVQQADRLGDIAEAMRPERKALRGLRRWWFLATRRGIA
jgi:hypothetical protein